MKLPLPFFPPHPGTHIRETPVCRLSEKVPQQVSQVPRLQTYFHLTEHHKGCQELHFPICSPSGGETLIVVNGSGTRQSL